MRSRSAKRDRQTAAAEERERLRRRARRLALARRLTIALMVIGIGVFVGAAVVRRLSPRPIPQAALAAAEAAGCSSVQTPSSSAPGGQHLPPGQPYSYPEEPATSGPHDPSPFPPDTHVYTDPQPETRAVHNLEHGYVLLYYGADGSAALPLGVVDALASLANRERKVIMAPSPVLSNGSALAFLAWNKLWTCPPTISPRQATSMASGFIEAFREAGAAPEAGEP